VKHIIVFLDDEEAELALKLRPMFSEIYKRSFTKKQTLALYAEQKMALNENERRVHAEGAHIIKIRIPILENTRTPLLDSIQAATFMEERLASSLFINKVTKVVFWVGMLFVGLGVYYWGFR
jgi:hypothetical protein